MKISDVIKQISSIVDTTPMDRSSGDNTSKFTAFTGDLTPVELPAEEAEVLRKPKTMPSGNDAIPDDLYLPPLQLKSELLKKAVDVENIFSDGTPAVRYDEEYGEEGWHGDEDEHNYVGAPQTAEQVSSEDSEQPDPNEELTDPYAGDRGGRESESDSERKRSDESLNRMLQLANLSPKKNLAEASEEEDDEEVSESWGHDDFDDFDSDVERADHELSRLGRAPIKAAVIDLDKDELQGDEDYEDEMDEECNRIVELSKGTLGSYVKKASADRGRLGNRAGTAGEAGRYDDEYNAVRKGHQRQHGIEAATDRLMKEEPVNELSKDTLSSYKDKAQASADKHFDLANKAAGRAQRGGKAETDRWMKHSEKFGKRKAGIDRASDRLSEEQLDELNKDTLGSYVKKATRDAINKADRAGTKVGAGHPGATDDYMDAVRREQGITRATDRLMREEEDEMADECSMSEAQELNRMKKNAGLNAVVLDELTDDNAV